MTGEPWFDNQTAGWVGGIGGSALGLMGGVFGSLCGWLVPKGRGRGLLVGSMVALFAFGVAGLIAAFTAIGTGQPYHVWYSFLLPGAMSAIFGGVFFFVLRKRYRDVELRKMHAEELR